VEKFVNRIAAQVSHAMVHQHPRAWLCPTHRCFVFNAHAVQPHYPYTCWPGGRDVFEFIHPVYGKDLVKAPCPYCEVSA